MEPSRSRRHATARCTAPKPSGSETQSERGSRFHRESPSRGRSSMRWRRGMSRLSKPLRVPLAARSSAVDEDGADASFAGQHVTLLNVRSIEDLTAALSEIWWSANSDSAITYRQRVGLFTRPSVGVVVQELLDPDTAGVMFTQNPVTGADERVIEASFGLGEAVVAGLVIPDNYRVSRSGGVLERTPGLKKLAVRTLAQGGTVEEQV